MLLFGDSYSSNNPHFLTGLLAETVSEVDFVWSTRIDWRHVAAVRPDILIYEIAERFMATPPRDDIDLRLLEARQYIRAQRIRLARWWRARASSGG